MLLWTKLKLLVWKNFIIQRRHKWVLLFEILSPVIFSTILILVRYLVTPNALPETNYTPYKPTFYNITQLPSLRIRTEDLEALQKKNYTVAYSPDSGLILNIVLTALFKILGDNKMPLFQYMGSAQLPLAFKNGEALDEALLKPGAMDSILCGIKFDDEMADKEKFEPGQDIKFALRFPAIMRWAAWTPNPVQSSWRTNLLFPVFPKVGPREPENNFGGNMPGYTSEMFLAMQYGLSYALITSMAKEDLEEARKMEVVMQRLPHLQFTDDMLLIALQRFVSLIIMIAFVYPFVNACKQITLEKQLQLKETMRIMGLPSSLHWLAWFIQQASYMSISVLLVVILMKLPLAKMKNGQMFSVMTMTPWYVLFTILMLYVIASIGFSFLVSVFFANANTASAFMGLVWFMSYSPFSITQVISENLPFTAKIFICLFSNSAMGYAFQMLIAFEGSGRSLYYSDLNEYVSYHDEFRPIHVVIMLLFDTFLYITLALYIEKINPGPYGVPLKWYFPFTKSFWCRHSRRNFPISVREDSDYETTQSKIIHEEEPRGLPVGVDIVNLTKTYKGKHAVENMNLKLYRDEILVLLGHNGAGKTTTISMLTGMIVPTSGFALINGYNIVEETKLARQSLGLCPQHNVLFPDLTVAEHIRFYSMLKGVRERDVPAEVDRYVALLGLEEKRHVMSCKLSGGQMRRLSVGAAMCGESSVVLLDEPTSGLDPAARRALWDLLLKEKKGRTIILTTHFMDEADVLGDRIAIMSGGRLKCYGSSYFLKKHYGIGYKLNVVKAPDCDVAAVTALLKGYAPEAEVNSNIGTELTYILPEQCVSSFSSMLSELEANLSQLGVESYGLSVTTLEEVFMRVGAETYSKDEDNLSHTLPEPKRKSYKFGKLTGPITVARVEHGTIGDKEYSHRDEAIQATSSTADMTTQAPEMEALNKAGSIQFQRIRGSMLVRNHIEATILKMFYHNIRCKFQNSLQLALPLFSVLISIYVSRSWSFVTKLPPLELSLHSGFDRTYTPVSAYANLTPGTFNHRVLNAYRNYFTNDSYPGMSTVYIGDEDMNSFYKSLIRTDLQKAQYESIVAATFGPRMVAWYSNFGLHDPAISLGTLCNAIMQAVAPGTRLRVTNHPLPFTLDTMLKIMASGASIGFQIAYNLGFSMAFITSFLVLLPIKERKSGAKLLQRVCGLKPIVLWGCAYLWDLLWLCVVSATIICFIACFQEVTFAKFSELGRVYLFLVLCSFASIPLHYLVAFFFESPATGFCKMFFINVFTGVMPFLVTEVLWIPDVGSPEIAETCDSAFSVLPLFSMSRAVKDLSMVEYQLEMCQALCNRISVNCTRQWICENLHIDNCCIPDNPHWMWSHPGVGKYIFAMIMVGVLSFCLLMLVEYKLINKLRARIERKLPPPRIEADENEDSDVCKERQLVNSLSESDVASYSLVVQNIVKQYRTMLAVKGLSFAIRRGECFGLLGINGAGKTSTFKMLTGDANITAGNAYVLGYSIKSEIRDVHKYIGYCPQFDALLDNLTAKETLYIYCLLRGIPRHVGDAMAQSLTRELGFYKHYRKRVYQYSGGTKRKLSTVIALLGNTPLVYLDEPTTGMDPASKRLVWACLSKSTQAGRSIVLTSHSMEECEALCTRLTIMAAGRLRCLGSLQHLKNKFSTGYTLIIKCENAQEETRAVVNSSVMENFTRPKLVETYLGIITYYMEDAEMPWSQIFAKMESLKGSLPIEDYSVTQSTLEQVFLRFTR